MHPFRSILPSATSLALLLVLACGESSSSNDAPGGAGGQAGGAGGQAGAAGGAGQAGAAGSNNGGTGGGASVGGNGGTAGATGGSSGGGGSAGSAGAGGCSYQVGWTSDVRGGLDGDVIRVTTLDREGPGSLAEALDTDGPRVIVFEVGGVIDLDTNTLSIKKPFVTIAGQTAPSPGITLIRGSLSISTHDVVLQHIRVRPGEAGQDEGWEPDGISLVSAYDTVVDHCSVSWAIDENLSASGPRFEGTTPDEWRENTSHRVTFIRNIVSEALSDSTHSKGPHSKGSLIHDNATDILIYGNLYASNVDRNPLFKGGARGAVVNNFVTNPGNQAVSYALPESEWEGHDHETGQLSIVGNVLHFGPDTSASADFFRGYGLLELYLDDNVADSLNGATVDMIGGDTSEMTEVTSPPTWPSSLVASPSSSVIATIEQDVGARPWDRDAIDQRVIQEAIDATGTQIDHESEGGGYPDHTPHVGDIRSVGVGRMLRADRLRSKGYHLAWGSRRSGGKSAHLLGEIRLQKGVENWSGASSVFGLLVSKLQNGICIQHSLVPARRTWQRRDRDRARGAFQDVRRSTRSERDHISRGAGRGLGARGAERGGQDHDATMHRRDLPTD